MNNYNEEVPAFNSWTDGVEYTTLQGWPTAEEIKTTGCVKGVFGVDTAEGIRCIRHLPTAKTVVAVPRDRITTTEIKAVAEDLSEFVDGNQVDVAAVTIYVKANDLL